MRSPPKVIGDDHRRGHVGSVLCVEVAQPIQAAFFDEDLCGLERNFGKEVVPGTPREVRRLQGEWGGVGVKKPKLTTVAVLCRLGLKGALLLSAHQNVQRLTADDKKIAASRKILLYGRPRRRGYSRAVGQYQQRCSTKRLAGAQLREIDEARVGHTLSKLRPRRHFGVDGWETPLQKDYRAVGIRYTLPRGRDGAQREKETQAERTLQVMTPPYSGCRTSERDLRSECQRPKGSAHALGFAMWYRYQQRPCRDL
jgi:hypothetical protein